MMVTNRSSSSGLRSPALNRYPCASEPLRASQSYHAPLVEVDIGLLADQVRVTATDTLDLRQGVHDFALSVNIGVEETENVLCFESV